MAFFDIRVLHRFKTAAQMYAKRERGKEKNAPRLKKEPASAQYSRYYKKAILVDGLDLNLGHTTNYDDKGGDIDDENEVDDEDEVIEDADEENIKECGERR